MKKGVIIMPTINDSKMTTDLPGVQKQKHDCHCRKLLGKSAAQRARELIEADMISYKKARIESKGK